MEDMMLRDELEVNEAQTIVELGHMTILNIVNQYKSFLKRNNLHYNGPIINMVFGPDGPNMSFNKEFEDWVFINSAILKGPVDLVVMLGEKEKEYGRRSIKRKAPIVRKRISGKSQEKSPDESDDGTAGSPS
jgi:hypothetical protein